MLSVKTIRPWFLAAFLALTLPIFVGAIPPPAQSYSSWKKQGSNYYCYHYYQTPGTQNYGYQTCWYLPSSPGWVYYIRSNEDHYWCRHPTPQNPAWNFNAEQWSFVSDGSFGGITPDCPVITPNGPKKPGNGNSGPPMEPTPPPPVPCEN
jgi:hypothetical protein